MLGMWYLKYKYSHSDCIYVPKLKKFKLSGQFFHIGRFVKKNHVFTTAIQKLSGKKENMQKYFEYLKNHPKIVKWEILSENTIMTLARHKTELKVYDTVYDSVFIHPAPAYMDKEGFEIIQLACWERKDLQDHIEVVKKNKTTKHFEILQFRAKKMDDLYSLKFLPNLAPQQLNALRMASKEGYYDFPRKISLTKLARLAKVSKTTFRENLKKAEKKIMPSLISE